MKDFNEILRYFPHNIYQVLKNTFEQKQNLISSLQEIRIRVNRPIILKTGQADLLIEYLVTQSEVFEVLEKLCNNSIYAYQNQICKGFITVRGGHRVGITGTAITENEKVTCNPDGVGHGADGGRLRRRWEFFLHWQRVFQHPRGRRGSQILLCHGHRRGRRKRPVLQPVRLGRHH